VVESAPMARTAQSSPQLRSKARAEKRAEDVQTTVEGEVWMRLIIDAFWLANCWTARVLVAPLESFVYLLTLLLTRRSKRTRRIGSGRRNTSLSA